MLVLGFILMGVIVLVLIKPYGLNEGVIAFGGVISAYLLGYVKIKSFFTVFNLTANATGALIGIMLIALILEDAGFFGYWALKIISYKPLTSEAILLIFSLLASTAAVFFNNDGSILIITPLAYYILKHLGVPDKNTLLFLFAVGFMADIGSLPLMVSNLVNILTADFFGLNFRTYLKLLLFPGIIGILTGTLVIYFTFRSKISKIMVENHLPAPEEQVQDWFLVKLGEIFLVFLLLWYAFSHYWQLPVSLGNLLVAGLMVFAAAVRKRPVKTNLQRAPWGVILFASSMYLLVQSYYLSGGALFLEDILEKVFSISQKFGLFATGVLSAILAAVINNLPATLLMNLTVKGVGGIGVPVQELAKVNVIGNCIGPKLTPIGSLATMLWLDILKNKGLVFPLRSYLKYSFLLTIPVLFATLITAIF